MKRLMTLFLAIVLAFSLSACGDSSEQAKASDTPEEETQAVENEQLIIYLGETVSTDQVEFKLTRFDFASRVYRPLGAEKERALEPISDDEAKEYITLEFSADGVLTDFPYMALKPEDRKVFATMSFTIKNIGKIPVNGYISVKNGSTTTTTRNIWGFVEVDYNDGYLFRNNDISVFYDCFRKEANTELVYFQKGGPELSLNVLEEAHQINGCIAVPEEVQNNTDKPLKINFYLPTGDGRYQTAVYTVR